MALRLSRRLPHILAALLAIAAAPALGQEEPEKNPFADPDMQPSYRAQCHEVRALTKDRETGMARVDFSVTGPLALVHFDGTLAYLGLCGTAPDPKVLCITYQTNDMKVGEVVTVAGGYSRPNPDFIVLDPCLATRPEEPAQ
ncbi:hypothetical protein [Microvirga arsenatis]|uniref:Uncharacterized protein n=1 Tax=Microvirga arsenatis TaxID=2692265 RepID=A0ABW9YZ18_9HYPH|nr:hypothetical protein [Microvirga arsenatis]NBJ11389.1 hypothetical protein [Microvirga arsenatis]NBJ25662.1 hypothetical protein [Microvirga arsenatis]